MGEWIHNELHTPGFEYAKDYLPGGPRFSEVDHINERIQEIIPYAYAVISPEGIHEGKYGRPEKYLEIWYYNDSGLDARGRRQAYRALVWRHPETNEPLHTVDNRLLFKLMEMDSNNWDDSRRANWIANAKEREAKSTQARLDKSREGFVDQVETEYERKKHKKDFTTMVKVGETISKGAKK